MSVSSQQFESYVPVYDAIPESWNDAKPFLVEQLKKISNAVNIREIGWFLDEELLSGKSFIPAGVPMGDATPPQFRSMLRKVIDFSPQPAGTKSVAHGITFDSRFSLLQLYGAATDAAAFTAIPVPNGATNTISMDATNINITTAAAYTRCYAVVEYMQEL